MQKTLFAVPLTESRTTDVEGVGRVRYEADGTAYRWVKNTESATALAQGDSACHTLGADLTTIVKIPVTANLAGFAGVTKSTSIAAGSYGWVQCFGYCDYAKLDGTTTDIAIGDSLAPVNSSVALKVDTAAGTASTRRFGAIALEAYTTDSVSTASKKVFLNGPVF